MKVKSDHRSKFSNLAIGKKKPEKDQGFNGIRTRDLHDTGAMLYQLSFVDLYKLARLVPIFVSFCTLSMAVPLAACCGSCKIKSADSRYNCTISKD